MENTPNNRINREEMYWQFVDTLSQRSTCPRKKVGAILVRDSRVISMGYNGVLPHINPVYGIDPETGQSRTVHAEANVISFCAKHGIPTEGAWLFISLSPCMKCAELIVQSGIGRIYYKEEYRDNNGLLMIKSYGIECRQYTK